MKSIKQAFSFMVSILVISVSVILLVLVALFSLCINTILFILMVAGLIIPVLGNAVVNKFSKHN